MRGSVAHSLGPLLVGEVAVGAVAGRSGAAVVGSDLFGHRGHRLEAHSHDRRDQPGTALVRHGVVRRAVNVEDGERLSGRAVDHACSRDAGDAGKSIADAREPVGHHAAVGEPRHVHPAGVDVGPASDLLHQGREVAGVIDAGALGDAAAVTRVPTAGDARRRDEHEPSGEDGVGPRSGVTNRARAVTEPVQQEDHRQLGSLGHARREDHRTFPGDQALGDRTTRCDGRAARHRGRHGVRREHRAVGAAVDRPVLLPGDEQRGDDEQHDADDEGGETPPQPSTPLPGRRGWREGPCPSVGVIGRKGLQGGTW